MSKKTGSVAAAIEAVALGMMVPGSAAADADTACTGDGVVASGTNQAEVEASLLCLVNRYRQDHGLGALNDDSRLSRASRAHSDDMRGNGYLAHDNPNSPYDTPAIRAAAVFYVGGVGENVGMTGGLNVTGVGTAWALFDTWRNSASHNANMLNGSWVASGLGASAGCWCGGANFSLGMTGTQMYGLAPADSGTTALNLNFGPIPGSNVKGTGTSGKKCKRKRAKRSATAAKKKKCKKKKRAKR